MFSGEDVDKKVSVLSGGERARLALACMLLKPFNLLVLDEPTNHLDMLSKEVLKQALMDYDGTLIVVSHDRDFLSGLTDKTIEFRDKQLFHHLGDVNYFLEKRALENMRELELSGGGKNGKKDLKPLKSLSYEERKKLQRAIKNAENKVERVESEITELETKMAQPEFYSSPDCQNVMNKFKEAKTKLDLAMEEWEKAQSTLEEFESE